MPRVQVLLTAAMLAFTAGACGNEAETDGGGGAGSCPQHDVRIMAPADPGGGWDSTAREMAEALRKSKVIDKGVEVYNVPGAGGTIGLSQVACKRAGQSNEIMVMGLVMPGAILTNDSPIDLSKTTPIAALTTEPEAIAVRSQSPPRPALTSAILVLATLGVYSISGSVTEVLIMYVIGAVGFFMRRFDFPIAPVILGVILGPLMEARFRAVPSWSPTATSGRSWSARSRLSCSARARRTRPADDGGRRPSCARARWGGLTRLLRPT